MDHSLLVIASTLRILGVDANYDLEASLGRYYGSSPTPDEPDSESESSTSTYVIQAVGRAWGDVKKHYVEHAQLVVRVTEGSQASVEDYAKYWDEHQRIIDHCNYVYLSISEPIKLVMLKYIHDAIISSGAHLTAMVRRVVSSAQAYDAGLDATSRARLDLKVVEMIEEVIKKGYGQAAAKEMIVAAAMRVREELAAIIPTTSLRRQGATLPGSKKSSRPRRGYRSRPDIQGPAPFALHDPATPYQPAFGTITSGPTPKFGPRFVGGVSRATRR
ncbi:uncharacterized protein BDZ99DRAFT_560165 [Mytilinidion resinicola]|uniref:Uncharacterized protein n=1 Tax=Mytilinidion resinicola TaxID=574789 RepID=A0A6A6YUY4_9PEZI|nr:uncharacterized protein BDZ99DRAFT_560165 [Mytilinidion resinicola]KAF2811767.1 hypothetical protein BDZ99DRAFT_560165 [Mytilinidion resinicola]